MKWLVEHRVDLLIMGTGAAGLIWVGVATALGIDPVGWFK